MEKKKILIIHTGGTIGMVRTENGYAPESGALIEELKQIRDLTSPDMPEWDLIEFEPLLDSTNVRYEQWNSIAEAISLYYDKYDGFVVLHGTDTLAYSASALSFMLEGLDNGCHGIKTHDCSQIDAELLLARNLAQRINNRRGIHPQLHHKREKHLQIPIFCCHGRNDNTKTQS